MSAGSSVGFAVRLQFCDTGCHPAVTEPQLAGGMVLPMHPALTSQLARLQRERAVPSRPTRLAASLTRRLWRRTVRPGRQLATDDGDVTPEIDVSVAGRPEWTRATCTAPNCAGHRVRP
jgi:hypothetical protein